MYVVFCVFRQPENVPGAREVSKYVYQHRREMLEGILPLPLKVKISRANEVSYETKILTIDKPTHLCICISYNSHYHKLITHTHTITHTVWEGSADNDFHTTNPSQVCLVIARRLQDLDSPAVPLSLAAGSSTILFSNTVPFFFSKKAFSSARRAGQYVL